MSYIRQYVESLEDGAIQEIIASYEKFERDGSIGDEPIRTHANALIASLSIPIPPVVLVMEKMAFECYRRGYYEGKAQCV
jgi:hypothetical protein